MRTVLLSLVAFAAVHAQVARYDVYEQTIAFPSAGYSNPWEQVTATMAVTSPTGVVTTVGGFYYGPDTWKARFAPAEIGTWTYQTTIAGSTTQNSSGSFSVIASTWPGFVRQSSQNRLRWVLDDGTPFHPLGIGDCISTGLNDMTMDTTTVTSSAYFAAFQAASVNLFRWNVDNCSYKLWSAISETGNSYLVAEGQAGDNLVRLLRQNNIRTFMAIFGFAPAYGTNPATAQMNAVKRYVKYVVDRYGAFVDIWELMNEATVSSTWYDQVALYLRTIDPYQHPISTNWEQPSQPRIEIVSPHWYQTEPLNEIDLYPAWKIRDWKAAGGGLKPVIVGEQGNATCNWDSTSAMRMRIRSWTSFFNEGSLIFWHTGYSKSYCNNPANIYLGSEERGYLKILQDFTSGFPANAAMTGAMNGTSGTLPVSDLSRVRAYGLTSATAYAAFLHAYNDHTNPTSGITITVAPQSAGVATWYSPSTGQTLGTLSVNAGSQVLNVPAFTSDIALKIATAAPPACGYIIAPTSATVASSGGSGTASVTANCGWTVISNASWLTSGSSGTANGSVDYAVAANTGTARTGTLTIAGQTFTVSQAAAGTQGPGAFSQIFPANGATGVQTSPTLTWSTSSGATSYAMYLGSAPNPPLNGSTTGTSWFAGGLGAGTYYWRVVSSNASGTTSTAEWSFSIGSGPIDFSVTANPNSLSLAPRRSAAIAVTATLTSGSAQAATFSAAGLPSGVTATWSTTSCTLSCAPTLTLRTGRQPAIGTATVTVTVVAGGVTKTANITLTTTSALAFPKRLQ